MVDPQRRPSPITGPVRILQGYADPDVPWTHAVRTMEALASTDVTLHLSKRGDHSTVQRGGSGAARGGDRGGGLSPKPSAAASPARGRSAFPARGCSPRSRTHPAPVRRALAPRRDELTQIWSRRRPRLDFAPVPIAIAPPGVELLRLSGIRARATSMKSPALSTRSSASTSTGVWETTFRSCLCDHTSCSRGAMLRSPTSTMSASFARARLPA
jgi:hypothetical protein